MNPARIMIVEDERISAHSLEQQLKKLGHSVVANVGRGEDAVLAAERERPDCILMDIHLADAMDGIAATEVIRARWDIPVVYLTAYADDETLARAHATAPYGYLVKPYEIRSVEAVLQMVDARHAAERALKASEARLNLALDAARMSDFEINPAAGRVHCHRHGHSLLGDTVGELSFDDLVERIHPDGRDQLLTAYRHSLETGDVFDIEFRLGGFTEQAARWLRVVGKVYTDGAIRHVYGVVEDVSARHENQARLAQAAQIVASASEAIFIADAAWRLESVNPAYRALLPDGASEALGHPPAILEQQNTELVTAIKVALVTHGSWQGELRFQPGAGAARHFWVSLVLLRDTAKSSHSVVGMLADISSLKAAQAKIEELAYHDALTGLPNRSLAHDRLAQAMLRSERTGMPFALLYIDLDRFKVINDRYGHEAGDKVLVETSHRMRSAIRQTDTLARLGGDEFIVIAEDVEMPQGALRVADELLQALSPPCAVADSLVACGASIGIAIYPQDAHDQDALLHAADQAMYQAKVAGGQRYCMFDANMLQALLPGWELEHELRRALLHKEFVLHYQIQVDTTGAIVGAEALARWRHPERGLLTPDQFIDKLEHMGMMDMFTQWVVQAACQQMAAWREQRHPIARVAVNVPPCALQHCALAGFIKETLARLQLPGACLEVEITESVLQQGLAAFACLDRIEALGCAIVLDDFGAGYASLSSIKHLPLVRLKIDREFVHDVEHNPRSVAIIETILSLATKLGMDVVAEGVETEAQLQRLKTLGCRIFQGYLFGRPTDPAALLPALRVPVS
ncbi:MAG: EAL domain-containing protein [Pseudomonadota bacterium]